MPVTCRAVTSLALACTLAALGGVQREFPLGVSFRMTFGIAAEKSPRFTVRAEEMRDRSVETNSAGAVVMRWCGHAKVSDGFSVTGVFSPRADGGWTYSLSYDGNSSGLDVEDVQFPEIEVPRSDSSRFLYPRQTGLLERPKWAAAKPGARLVSFGPRFKGFHFVSLFTDGEASWYLDTRGDSWRHPVSFALYNGERPSSARIAASCAMAASSAQSGRLPYEGVVRRFDGGWYDAARIYREWAVCRPEYAKSVALRKNTPRLREIGLWLWNRGRSDAVTGVVDRVRSDSGVPVALDWYWWHNNPYGAMAPYYWPPREDLQTFSATIRSLREKGVYVQHYINGMCCDMKDSRWTAADLAETAVKRNGEYFTSLFNRFIGHPSAWMCGAAPVFQGRVADQTKQLALAGSDSVYIDMIANDACYACWSTSHGHPRGGGTHVVDGYKAMVARIRRENPGVHISSEEEAEAFLGLFESLIVLYGGYERLAIGVGPDCEMLPVYMAIYHEAVTCFGNFATLDNVPPWDEKWPEDQRRRETRDLVAEFPDQFAVEVGRSAAWGLQPCAHSLLPKHATEAKFAPDYRFLCDTAAFYHANREFLYDGEMLAPGRLTCENARVDFLQRGTYTKDGVYKTWTQEALPTVFHSVWRAPDGRVGAVLVNWSRQERKYDLETPDVKASGVIPPRSWRLVSRK